MTGTGSLNKRELIAYIAVGVLCVLLFFRIQYGFDPIDESHYYALAKRFCQGDIPFINEWHPSQFFAVLICPFFYFFSFFVPSGDGVILAGRYMYFAIQIIVMLYLFYVLKDKTYKWQVVVIYLMCSKQNNPAPNYYNLFMTFSLVATFSFVRYFEKGKGIVNVIIAGVCISIATLCMPFFAIGVALLTIALWFTKKRKELLALWGSILFFAAIYLGFLLTRASLFEYISSMKYVLFNPSHESMNLLHKSFRTILSYGKVSICGVPGFLYLMMRLRKYSLERNAVKKSVSFEAKDNIVFLISLVLCVIASGIIKPGAIFLQITFLSFPYMVNELGNIRKCNDKTNIEPVLLYFIGLVIALLFWLGSDTGATSLVLGFIISVIGVSIIFEQIFYGKQRIIYSIVLITSLILPRLCGLNPHDNYWWKLDTQISYGPAKGLYTEKTDAEDYYIVCDLIDISEGMFSDQEVLEKEVLFSPFLPWGYLYSDFRNGSMTTWTAPISSKMLSEYYELHPEKFPDVVIIINDDYGNINGIAGGGRMYNATNHKQGEIWEKIKNRNNTSTEVGSIYW